MQQAIVRSRFFNRWMVVVGAVMIQLALGAIYAWSVFTVRLTDPAGPYAFSSSQAAWIFSAGLATFAVVMIFAGRWQTRVGPMLVAFSGGALLGAGYILGGFFGHGFWSQLVTVGLLGGAGIGLAYVVPIAVGIKWFPERKGMITGLAVAGFGFGATIWVKLADSWFGGLLNTARVFNLPAVQSVFVLYGAVFAALVMLGSLVMVNPPPGYRPAGGRLREAVRAHDMGGHDVQPREMLRSGHFYLLWTLFMFSALAGLMVIYCIRLFGMDALAYHGVANAGLVAGTAMAWYAVTNGLGRIVWGAVSDRMGRRGAIATMMTAQGIVMLLVYHGFILFGSAAGFIAAAALIGFNFGGNFALFPAATADYFGDRNVGVNYGWVFTAYGIAGILGPQLAGMVRDAAGANSGPIFWMAPFLIAAGLCLLGALLMLLLGGRDSAMQATAAT